MLQLPPSLRLVWLQAVPGKDGLFLLTSQDTNIKRDPPYIRNVFYLSIDFSAGSSLTVTRIQLMFYVEEPDLHLIAAMVIVL